MKHSRSKVFLLLALLSSATTLLGRPQLKNLDIQVVLAHNGDAYITETRTMDIDSEGTECYIVIGNLNGSEVRDLKVSDETGLDYINLGDWDIDESRSYKAGKCGIVNKRNGYELCWGLGDSGSRTYITNYTVTNLVKAFDDADGLGVSPSPDHVKLTIIPEDSVKFSTENSKIWGFRYKGDINFMNYRIVAETSEPFENRSAMIIMCRFDKGLFEPTDIRDGSFETIKDLAFDGSDYTNEDEWTWEDTLILIALAIGFIVFPLLILIGYLIYVWRERRKVNKNLMWYRDIPYDGNLQRINDVLNAYQYFNTDYNNLLSACILKLINLGAITIEQVEAGA